MASPGSDATWPRASSFPSNPVWPVRETNGIYLKGVAQSVVHLSFIMTVVIELQPDFTSTIPSVAGGANKLFP